MNDEDRGGPERSTTVDYIVRVECIIPVFDAENRDEAIESALRKLYPDSDIDIDVTEVEVKPR